MEQTIRNMELLLVNLKKELESRNYRESKTIMNTYRALLSRFTELSPYDERINQYRIQLESHKNQLDGLHKSVEKNIETLIINNEYMDADNLVEVSWRLNRASADIEQMIKQRIEQVNRFNKMMLNDLRMKQINSNNK